MEPDDLEGLAEQGRAQQAAEHARRAREQSGDAKVRRRERQLGQWRSVSRYARWGWFPVGSAGGLLVAWLLAKLLPQAWFVDAEGDWGGAGGLALTVLAYSGPLVARAARGFFGERAVAREEAWVRALPFRLTGYLEALGKEVGEGTAQLTLHYEDTAKAPVVGDALRALGGKLTRSDDGRTDTVAVEFSFDESVETNAHLVAWVHRASAAALAVHARFRITQVALTVDWQR